MNGPREKIPGNRSSKYKDAEAERVGKPACAGANGNGERRSYGKEMR